MFQHRVGAVQTPKAYRLFLEGDGLYVRNVGLTLRLTAADCESGLAVSFNYRFP
ncbi:MAG: hypothetical protein ACTTH7_00620 [Treponema sp.]